MRRVWRQLRGAVLLGLALVIFLPMVGARDVVTSHEARVVQTARQMAASGWPWAATPVAVPVVAVREIDGMKRVAPVPGAGTFEVNPWLIPVMNGQVRLQKPPLPYWCAAVLYRLMRFGEGPARLPCALMGAVAVILVLDLGRRTIGRTGGWLAALIFLSSYFIFDEYRKAMADPALAFFSLLSVWAWVAASRARARRRGACILLFYVSLGLGALAKAPLNFLHVGIALGAFHLCFRRRIPGSWWHHLLGVVLLLGIGLPWPWYVLTHVRQINRGPLLARLELWRYESVGEFTDNTEKARGWWFYFPAVLQIALPWTPLWVLGVVRALNRTRWPDWMKMRLPRRLQVAGSARRTDHRTWFPLLWFAVTLLVFSISNVKKNAYLLPMMPAMALTAAQGLMWVLAGLRRPQWKGSAESAVIVMILIGAGFGLVLPNLIYKWAPRSGVVARLPSPTVTLGLASLAMAALMALPAWLAWRRAGGRAWAFTQAITFAVAIALFFHFANAPFDNRRSAKQTCRLAIAMLQRDPDATLLMPAVPEEASVYLPLGMRYDPDKPHVLVIVDDRTRNARADPAWFQNRIPGRRVVGVQTLTPQLHGDTRWKLFDVTVDRRWLARAE